MSTKKEKKENQVAKATPKWGTQEWIMVYPWSKMDKDRRRRVRKVLKDEDQSLFNPMGRAVEYIDYLCKMLAKAKVTVQKSTVKETKEAAAKVDGFMMGTRDALIAQALYKHWCDKKPCSGCCNDKKPCKKPCDQTCKQTCKKPAKAKK